MIKSYAPGRAVLLGDGAEGPALFIAIDRGVLLSGTRRDDDEILVYARDLPGTYEGSLENLVPSTEKPWVNPLLGVIDAFRRRGWAVGGLNLTIQSDLPAGDGLGSGTALAWATALFLHRAFSSLQTEPDAVETAEIVREAMRRYGHAEVSLADALSPFVGRSGHATWIDHGMETIEYLPLPPGSSFVIASMGEETHREDDRVKAAAQALRRGDAAAFGALLADQHRPGMPIQLIQSQSEATVLDALQTALPGVPCLCAHASAGAHVDGY